MPSAKDILEVEQMVRTLWLEGCGSTGEGGGEHGAKRWATWTEPKGRLPCMCPAPLPISEGRQLRQT